MSNEDFLNDLLGDVDMSQDDESPEDGVEEAETGEETTEAPKVNPRETIRAELRKQEVTLEQAAEKRAELQLTDEELDSWIKLAKFSQECRARNIPVSRLVKATGGDRTMNPPINDRWQVRWHGRVRYIHEDAWSDEGFAELAELVTPREAKSEPTVEDGLKSHTKKELLELAAQREMEIDPKTKKADIVQMLIDGGVTIEDLDA